MSLYLFIKHLHIASVTLSLVLFLARWWLQGQGREWRRQAFWRLLPHINDSVLLLAAITLVVLWGGLRVWMLSKIAALLLYILLGRQALRTQGRTSLFHGTAALCVFAFIVSVALTKNPGGILVSWT